jgi:two-component system, OmpR family, response regulator
VRLLVVEDATRLREIVLRRLREEGFAADGTGGGADAIALAGRSRYDAIVLDLRLPDVDGLEVCSQLRSRGCRSPILMLTARDALDDRVRGLDLGADDYLTKPFEFPELFARIRALVRRGAGERTGRLLIGDLCLDPAAHTVERGNASIQLTTKEFALLEYLLRHRRAVLSRHRLIDAVWDAGFQGDPNIVDVYIRRLRDKVDRPFGRSSLRTVRGIGYQVVDDSA